MNPLPTPLPLYTVPTSGEYGVAVAKHPPSTRTEEGQLILLEALADAYQSQIARRPGERSFENQCHIITTKTSPSPLPGINVPPFQPIITNEVERLLPEEFRRVPVEANRGGATNSLSTRSEAAYSTPHNSVCTQVPCTFRIPHTHSYTLHSIRSSSWTDPESYEEDTVGGSVGS